MRAKSILLAGLSAAAALIAGQASAAILLSDNFDAGSPHGDQLNWTGDATFSVTTAPGSVDLIGAGGSFDFLPGHGGYLDLDGSSGSGHAIAGEITSVLNFGPGTYTLTFDLAGNQRGATAQSTTVTLGDFSQTFGPLDSSAGFTTQTLNFTTTTAGHLVFTEHGPSDQQGNLLDNVTLAGGIPEPATWAMMVIGFGGMGGILRYRRRQLALA